MTTRERAGSPRQYRPVCPFGPVHKSFCGTGGKTRHGCDRGVKPQEPRPARSADFALVGESREGRPRGWRVGGTAGGREAPTRRRSPAGAELRLRRTYANPTDVAGVERPRPGRENGPSASLVREPRGTAAANDSVGRRLANEPTRSLLKRQSRGVKNRTGEPPVRRESVGRAGERRSGMAWRLVAFGRYGAAGERRRDAGWTAKPHERWPADLFARVAWAANPRAR